MEENITSVQNDQELNELLQIRRDKLKSLQERGRPVKSGPGEMLS